SKAKWLREPLRSSPLCALTSDLAVAVDHKFVAAQLAEAHRAAGVEAIGADADLGAVAELETIVEARARVPEDRGAVDARLETARSGLVTRDDRVAVAGAVAVDRGDGGVERIDDAYGEDEIEELGSVVGRDGRADEGGI